MFLAVELNKYGCERVKVEALYFFLVVQRNQLHFKLNDRIFLGVGCSATNFINSSSLVNKDHLAEIQSMIFDQLYKPLFEVVIIS